MGEQSGSFGLNLYPDTDRSRARQIILSVFGVHLIGWAFLFIMSLSVGARNPSQENCDSDLPVAFWSRAVGIAAIICWFAMVLLWLLLLVSMKRWRTKSRGTPRQDVLQM